MKRILTYLFVLMFGSTFVCAQSENDLIKQGINYHDNREYNKALESYNAALKMNPKSYYAHFEIALTYGAIKEYNKAIKSCDEAIKIGHENVFAAYEMKASFLDNLGKVSESIKTFEEVIKIKPDYFRAFYNLAITHQRNKNYEKAKINYTNALSINPNHVNSHLHLGLMMQDLNRPVQSVLCLYYYLLLEPESQRTKEIYPIFRNILKGNMKVNGVSGEITITMDSSDKDFGTAALLLSMMGSHKNEEVKLYKDEGDRFVQNTKMLLKMLGELKTNNNPKDNDNEFWWDFYIPFLANIANSDHIEAFCYYISMGADNNAKTWVEKNGDKILKFTNWINEGCPIEKIMIPEGQLLQEIR